MAASGGNNKMPIGELMRLIRARAQDKMEWARERESGFILKSITTIRMLFVPTERTVRVSPFAEMLMQEAGGSAVQLPASLLRKKCCINVQNRDSFCFRYCMIGWGKEFDKVENPSARLTTSRMPRVAALILRTSPPSSSIAVWTSRSSLFSGRALVFGRLREVEQRWHVRFHLVGA